MKKIFFAALTGMLCIFTSCDNNNATVVGKGDTQREKNLASVDIIDQAFKTGDVSKLDSAVATDFLDHTDQGDKVGRDSLKTMVTWLHKNFTDMKTEKLHELADDEYVMSWMRWTGTSKGVPSMPDGPYDMHAMEVTKFKDGKAVEHWTYMDMKEMMKMMAPPPPPMETKKIDTVKAK
ncbi:MAG TPA: ester cyclase [Chitinophagaceae bacterium]|nr:ester cyclase [Chitinophagaceae bacterium]